MTVASRALRAARPAAQTAAGRRRADRRRGRHLGRLGSSIHDVVQVVASDYLISPRVGDAAVFVKLVGVAMLLPLFLAGLVLVGVYPLRRA